MDRVPIVSATGHSGFREKVASMRRADLPGNSTVDQRRLTSKQVRCYAHEAVGGRVKEMSTPQ